MLARQAALIAARVSRACYFTAVAVQLELPQNQLSLSWVQFETPDAEVRLMRGFLDTREARQLFEALMHSIPWTQDEILCYGRRVPIPRLHRWMSESGKPYAWSGIEMEPLGWTREVLGLRDKLSELVGVDFNGVLINLYRDGKDSVSWHADNEAIFGSEPTIASVSLGETRDFLLRHRTRPELGTLKVPLEHGSLLLMAGQTQTHWVHSLPRRAGVKGPRINLTFRRLVG